MARITIRDYVARKHGKWAHSNQEIIYPADYPVRYTRSVYNVLSGWVIYLGNKPIGCCLYDVCDNGGWYLAVLFVLPEYQCRGYGTLLLHKMLDLADGGRMRIECHSSKAGMKLYSDNGFFVRETDRNFPLMTRRPFRKK